MGREWSHTLFRFLCHNTFCRSCDLVPWLSYSSLGTPKKQKLDTMISATIKSFWLGMHIPLVTLVKYSMSIRRYWIPLLLSRKGPAMLIAILFNSNPTLYCRILPWLWVHSPWFAAKTSYCWHHLSMLLLTGSQQYTCINLSGVLLISRCPPEDPPWRSAVLLSPCSGEEQFGLSWAICQPIASGIPAKCLSLLGSSTEPSNLLTGLWSVMFFHSGHCPASTSCRTGTMLLSIC